MPTKAKSTSGNSQPTHAMPLAFFSLLPTNSFYILEELRNKGTGTLLYSRVPVSKRPELRKEQSSNLDEVPNSDYYIGLNILTSCETT